MAKKSNMAVPSPMDPKKNMDGGPDDYEAADAYRNIERAHEHMADPKMMARVKKHAGRKIKALAGMADRLQISSIADLRKASSNMQKKKRAKLAGDAENSSEDLAEGGVEE